METTMVEMVSGFKSTVRAWKILKWRISLSKVPSIYDSSLDEIYARIRAYFDWFREPHRAGLVGTYNIQTTYLDLMLSDNELISNMALSLLCCASQYSIDKDFLPRIVWLLRSKNVKAIQLAARAIAYIGPEQSRYERGSHQKFIDWATLCIHYRIPEILRIYPTLANMYRFTISDICAAGEKYELACRD
jgi:hypothetical protein